MTIQLFDHLPLLIYKCRYVVFEEHQASAPMSIPQGNAKNNNIKAAQAVCIN